MKQWIDGFFMAWGMFLAIPCPARRWNEQARGRMLLCLPLIGLVVGGVWAGVSLLPLPAPLRAALLTLAPWLTTGFLHLDGYMDLCDAVLSRRDLDTRRKILKDSHCGAFSVICMVLLALGQWSVFLSAEGIALWPLALVPVASRACAALAVLTLRPMQTSQYAGSFAAGKTKTQRRILFGMYIAVMFVVFLWLFSKPSCALAVAWAGLTTILACRLARRNLGGMSGDIAGFSITLGELSGLLILAIF